MAETNLNLRGTRMAVNVGEAFLKDAEKGRFHQSRQSLRGRREVDSNRQPTTLGEALQVPLCGTEEACLVQKWGMEQVRG
ncbi:MAG: hypothetical protein H0X25_22480, partial [Acidobacteriales bacterium]|nr:hypothetical protein [Terriglobales bacterium]